ncbi:unnamed protein product [Camellia sinensis]
MAKSAKSMNSNECCNALINVAKKNTFKANLYFAKINKISKIQPLLTLPISYECCNAQQQERCTVVHPGRWSVAVIGEHPSRWSSSSSVNTQVGRSTQGRSTSE